MDTFSQWFSQLQWENLLELLISALSCVVCIVLHELCHGLAALLMGDDTARRAGRLSLNPLKHIDPIGLVLLFTVHFGWAKPVPVNCRRFKNPKLGMALTALAGPLGNLLLACLLTMCYAVCAFWHQHSGFEGAYYWAVFFLTTVNLSVGLAVFNLLPIPPLDGSKILFSVLPANWYGKLMRYERYGMILLVALLYLRILDTPLRFLRGGILNGILSVFGEPIVRLLIG